VDDDDYDQSLFTLPYSTLPYFNFRNNAVISMVMMTTINSTHIRTHSLTHSPTDSLSLTHTHPLSHSLTQQCGDIDDDDYDQKLAAAGDDPSIDANRLKRYF